MADTSARKSLNSRFTLNKLDENIAELVSQVEALKDLAPHQGKKIFVFATLHYWIEHAALTAFSLSAMGYDVTLGFLPYHDWQNDINKFDLRRQNIYAEKVLGKAANVITILPFLNLHTGYKTLPLELQEKIIQVTRFDSMYTLQEEKVDEKSSIYKMRCKRNLQAARSAYAWMDENKPDVVIVPNGTIQEFGVVYEVARYLKISTVTYEFGDQRQRIWISQNSKVMRQDTTEMWETLKGQTVIPTGTGQGP